MQSARAGDRQPLFAACSDCCVERISPENTVAISFTSTVSSRIPKAQMPIEVLK